MKRKVIRTIALGSFALVVMLGAAWQAHAQDTKTPYPNMAPVDQYLIADRDAEVMVLGRHGYEIAVKGKNGFVCLVERSWTAPIDDPNFWNPKLRGPLCLNAPAVRTYLPQTIRKTDLVLAGRSKDQMAD